MIGLNQKIGFIVIKLLFFLIITRCIRVPEHKSCIEKMSCSVFYIPQYSAYFSAVKKYFWLIKKLLSDAKEKTLHYHFDTTMLKFMIV